MTGCKSIWFKTGVISSLLLAAGLIQSSAALSLFGALFLTACLIGTYACDDGREMFEIRKPSSGVLPAGEDQVRRMYCMFIESNPRGMYHAVLEHQIIDDMYLAALKELEALFGRQHVHRISRSQFVIIKRFPHGQGMDEQQRDIHQRWVTNSVSQVLSNLIAVYDRESMQMTELSIGTAASGLRYRARSVEQLIELAYFTLKHAQENRVRYLVADEKIRARKFDIDECKDGFKSEEGKKEFNPFFQPIIDPEEYTIVGFESLARWQLGGFRILDAGVFKDLAYELKKIEMIDAIIIEKTFSAARELLRDNLIRPNSRIVINISAATLSSLSPDQLAVMAEENNLSCTQIEFDIKDQELSDEILRNKAAGLRLRGFRIALDAFDSKAFDLSAFFYHQFDSIKLDFSHYAADEDEYRSRGHRVYGSLIHMAQNLSVQTLAKGIESRQQLTEARKLDVDFLQGSYFTPPVSLVDFRIFLKKYRTGIYLEEYDGSHELA
jgi:EAL domain-containing protein (putative c-di-GMP-specific phosphodiesterase class I)